MASAAQQDKADRHVERWRHHWVLDEPFDDGIEAMTVRINAITRFFRTTTKTAVSRAGLQDFEYETLHALMIRDVPGQASPGELAEQLGVSNAGMTGRLDLLEKRGWITRAPGAQDRRRVVVEATRDGVRTWREAMHLRGEAEVEVGRALTDRELATLNRLLKKMTLHLESLEEGTGAVR